MNIKDQRQMLQELLEVESGLTEKEIEFLDSLTNWEGRFTDKQEAWLKRIWNKVYG